MKRAFVLGLAILAGLVSEPSSDALAARGERAIYVSASTNLPPVAADVCVLAWPGGIGIPKVITWASTTGDSGIAWGSTSAIAAANASVTYNGTNLVENVPSAKGFAFSVNAGNVVTIGSTGTLTFVGSGAAPNAAVFGINDDGTNLILNVPSTKGFVETVAGTTILAESSLGALTLTPQVGAGVGLTLTEPVQTSGATGYLTITGAASTGQTAATEINFINFNLGQTVTWTAGATIANEREVWIQQPTLAASGAQTFTSASTLEIAGAPVAGAGPVTISQAYAIKIAGGQLGCQNIRFLSTAGNQITTVVTDGASAVAFAHLQTAAFATVGAKLMVWNNGAGAEKLSLKWDSGLVFNGTAIPAATDAGISTDAAAGNLFLNVPTGKTLKLGINAVQSLQVAPQTLTVGQTGGQTNVTKNGTGALWLVDGTGAGDQVILTDTAGAAVFAVGTLGDGTNGVRGTTTRDLAIQSGAGRNLLLKAPNGQILSMQVANAGGVYAEIAQLQVNGFVMAAGASIAVDGLKPSTSGGNLGMTDSAGNTMATFFDDGTTGSLKLTSTKSRGTITLSSGTGTATVNAGAFCVCDESTALNAVRCSVSSTTLTATGTGSDVINYLCL